MRHITHLTTRVCVAAAALALMTTAAAAQGTQASYKHDIPEKLAKRAKITEDSASKIAQAKIPSGTIEAVELESEKGRLQYSYDIKVAGKSGIEEVNVSAKDGHVIGMHHESGATEKAEAAAEKIEKKKP